MYQHVSDWHNNQGVIRQAEEQGMGIILMRPLTSGVFQRLMAQAFPEIDVLDVGRLLLNYVLSDPYVDVALVGMREPRFVELNNEISDDVASRIDLAAPHDRYVRHGGVLCTGCFPKISFAESPSTASTTCKRTTSDGRRRSSCTLTFSEGRP